MSTSQPTNEDIRDFVIAGHGNLAKVQEMLTAQPILLNLAHEWRPGDTETALQGAAHVGNRAVAEFLLAQGAPLDICTAAMLGQHADVGHFLQQDAGLIKANGAHGIPLLCHATLSGDVAFVEKLFRRGATNGGSLALTLAVTRNDNAMARWLLENAKPDLAWKNFQEKTALEIAQENGNEELSTLLSVHAQAG